MPDSPDPLGKRALFWAPAERVEDAPRRRAVPGARGKHALFSAAEAAGEESFGRGTATAREEGPGRNRSPDADEASVRPLRPSGIFGPVTLDCSSCGSRSDVDLFEFFLLHLPWWMWRPGKGYTRLMTCPACRRRSWISASVSRSR